MKSNKIIISLVTLIILTGIVFFVAPSPLFSYGNSHMHDKNKDNAIKAYQIGLFLRPNDLEANFNLGKTYQDGKQNDKAIKQYLKVIDIDPYDREANNNLANIYTDQNKFTEAEKLYNKVLENNPDDEAVNINIAELYIKQNKLNEALKIYEKIMNNSSSEYLGYVFYDLAHIYSIKNEKIKALDYLKKSFAINNEFINDAIESKDFENIKNEPLFKKLVSK